jgi:hypothetical protein
MYGPYEILVIISPTAVHLCLPKTLKVHPVFDVSLIEPFVKGNRDLDLNLILPTSDPIDNAPEYDIHTVMGLIEQDRWVLDLLKWTGWLLKKC